MRSYLLFSTHYFSTETAPDTGAPRFWTEWTRNSSRGSGKSDRKCPPRDSSRHRAALATSRASVTKLREDVPRLPDAIWSNSLSARFSEASSRIIPTLSHITRLMRFLTAVETGEEVPGSKSQVPG